jgi:hypothetical protein
VSPRPPCWSFTTSSSSCYRIGGPRPRFFHVVNDRYDNRHPTSVTTNRGRPDWGDEFGDSVVASAILDR